MLGFRINPPSPFWFEDLVFLVVDEARRLPARSAKAAAEVRRFAKQTAEAVSKGFSSGPAALLHRETTIRPTGPSAVVIREEARLEEPQAWSLATEPLAAVGTGTAAAIAFHQAAHEQLDALTYVVDRIREEVRPLMTYARFSGDEVHQLQTRAELDNSIEALLALSRANTATRPKARVLTAA